VDDRVVSAKKGWLEDRRIGGARSGRVEEKILENAVVHKTPE
jgi:hypothetical protein